MCTIVLGSFHEGNLRHGFNCRPGSLTEGRDVRKEGSCRDDISFRVNAGGRKGKHKNFLRKNLVLFVGKTQLRDLKTHRLDTCKDA